MKVFSLAAIKTILFINIILNSALLADGLKASVIGGVGSGISQNKAPLQGIALGGAYYWQSSEQFALGIRISYLHPNSFIAGNDPAKLLHQPTSSLAETGGWIFEMGPFLRLSTALLCPINFFGQLGGGIAVTDYQPETQKESLQSPQRKNGFAIQGGAGLIIGKHSPFAFQLMGNQHFLLLKRTVQNYLAISAGAVVTLVR